MARKYYISEPCTPDSEVPPGLVKIATMIAKRDGREVEAVIEQLIHAVVTIAEREPDRLTALMNADKRYCELEGLDFKEYSRVRCDATCKELACDLRREWKQDRGF